MGRVLRVGYLILLFAEPKTGPFGRANAVDLFWRKVGMSDMKVRDAVSGAKEVGTA